MEHADSKKNLILKTAAEHFVKYGYTAVSLRAIASDCGVTHPAIYKHFSGKADLAGTFIRKYINKMIACDEDFYRTASAKDAQIYYWLMHFCVIYNDQIFSRFFYEFLTGASDEFMNIELNLPFPTAFQSFYESRNTTENLPLIYELLNGNGITLGQHCRRHDINPHTATAYIMKIMNALAPESHILSKDYIHSFFEHHPSAVHYISYDLISDELKSS